VTRMPVKLSVPAIRSDRVLTPPMTGLKLPLGQRSEWVELKVHLPLWRQHTDRPR
jgi:hypothetical protein